MRSYIAANWAKVALSSLQRREEPIQPRTAVPLDGTPHWPARCPAAETGRMAGTLPPGVSESAMDRAVAAFAAALGSDAVVTSERELREYRDPYAYVGSDEFTASAVVLPTSVEQVQAVVRVANEFKVPLWTFGQGRNYTYGGPAPRVRGSVIVSLRGMNRVLEVSDELAYALVEPGVRFFDLYDHLRAGGP